MGIKDLRPFIEKKCPGIVKEISIKDLGGAKVSVDIMVFLYKYLRSAGEENWIPFMIQCLSTFVRYRVDIVCVFDGKLVPKEKEKERAKRRENTQTIHNKIKEIKELIEVVKAEHGPIEDKKTITAVNNILAKQRNIEGHSIINFKKRSTILWVLNQNLTKWEKQTLFVTEEHIQLTKELCKILRIPVYQAKGEGETICACLCLGQKVDAVYTQDTDVLAYGCPVQLYDFDVKNETVKMMYLEDVLDGFGFTFEQFQDFCIMLSCDYNDRVKGVGPVYAYDLLDECISIEGILETSPDEFLTKKTKTAGKKVQEDVEILNYERCRELFKYRRVVDVKWRPIDKIDTKKLNEFLKKTSTYSAYKMSAERLVDVWQPTKIEFE